jgi:hypothetical protein
MGSASLLTLTNVLAAQAQQVTQAQMAQARVPEQVLITGSLIHGWQRSASRDEFECPVSGRPAH